MEYTVYNIKCTVCSIQYTVYCIQYKVYSIQCTVYSIQYKIYSVQWFYPRVGNASGARSFQCLTYAQVNCIYEYTYVYRYMYLYMHICVHVYMCICAHALEQNAQAPLLHYLRNRQGRKQGNASGAKSFQCLTYAQLNCICIYNYIYICVRVGIYMYMCICVYVFIQNDLVLQVLLHI